MSLFTNLAVFFNIVRNAFDPPTLPFEHLEVFFDGLGDVGLTTPPLNNVQKTAGLEERDIPYHHCHHDSLTIGVIVMKTNNLIRM